MPTFHEVAAPRNVAPGRAGLWGALLGALVVGFASWLVLERVDSGAAATTDGDPGPLAEAAPVETREAREKRAQQELLAAQIAQLQAEQAEQERQQHELETRQAAAAARQQAIDDEANRQAAAERQKLLDEQLAKSHAALRKDREAGVLRSARSRVEIQMYSTQWCGYCRKARNYMKGHGIRYIEYDIDADPDARRVHRRLNPRGGVPTIKLDDEVIVGFSAKRFEATIDRAARKRL